MFMPDFSDWRVKAILLICWIPLFAYPFLFIPSLAELIVLSVVTLLVRSVWLSQEK